MTGRGVDQILPLPSDPVLHEPYVQSALEYVAMAEQAHGPIPKPVGLSYIWGDALEELDRVAPAARIVNLETSVTTSDCYESKGINYRMHPANTPCLTAAKIDCCVLANNHTQDWGRSGLADTIRALRKAGIKTAGAGHDLKEALTPAVIDVCGRSRVLVFAAGTGDSGIEREWAAAESTSGVALLPDLSEETVGLIAERVASVKGEGDIAVLSIHWGENWGYEIPRQHRRFARKLIDLAKIDVVYGPAMGRFEIARQAASSIRLLETVAERAANDLVWPMPFTLEMQSCDFPNARWDLSTYKLTLCYELGADFADLYRTYGDARADGSKLEDNSKRKTVGAPAYKPNRKPAQHKRKLRR